MLKSLVKHFSREKVTVLLFHKLPLLDEPLAPGESTLTVFEQVLDFVCAHFRILPYPDVVAGLRGGKLPANGVCITFDDGYADWMSSAIPALERRNAHATLFLTTGQFDGMPMWHERIRHAVQLASGHIEDAAFNGQTLPVNTLMEKRWVVGILDHAYKYLPLAEREVRLRALEQRAGSQPADLSRLTAAQVRDIANRGFTIGAHTENHPILTLSTEAEVRHEFGAARETLRAITGTAVDCLAYPNGRQHDFNASHVQLAREAGYTSAVMTMPGVICTQTSLFHIPRFTPWGPDPLRMWLQMSRNLLRSPSLLSRGMN